MLYNKLLWTCLILFFMMDIAIIYYINKEQVIAPIEKEDISIIIPKTMHKNEEKIVVKEKVKEKPVQKLVEVKVKKVEKKLTWEEEWEKGR